nr:uncharacterized protein LOC116147235 [Camelus dromedarius]
MWRPLVLLLLLLPAASVPTATAALIPGAQSQDGPQSRLRGHHSLSLEGGERRTTEKRGADTQRERTPEGHRGGETDIGRGPEGQRRGDPAGQMRVRNKEIKRQTEQRRGRGTGTDKNRVGGGPVGPRGSEGGAGGGGEDMGSDSRTTCPKPRGTCCGTGTMSSLPRDFSAYPGTPTAPRTRRWLGSCPLPASSWSRLVPPQIPELEKTGGYRLPKSRPLTLAALLQYEVAALVVPP